MNDAKVGVAVLSSVPSLPSSGGASCTRYDEVAFTYGAGVLASGVCIRLRSFTNQETRSSGRAHPMFGA